MRIRGTKPEFWRSARIAGVSWDARLVLKGLESYVDDNGVGKDDNVMIVSDLFSRDLAREPSRTLARVLEAVTELHRAGLVWRYEVEGERLLYVSWWETVQRVDKAQKGRFPRPDGTFNYKDSQIGSSLANIREPSRGLAPGTGEQGNRGTGEQPVVTLSAAEAADPDDPDDLEAELLPDDPGHAPTVTGYPAAFEAFWKTYPRRGGKGAACTAFLKATKRATTEVIIDGAARLRDDPNLPTDRSLIPMPATWLNQDRWEDDPLPARSQDMSSSQRRLMHAAQAAQEFTAPAQPDDVFNAYLDAQQPKELM